MLRLVFRQVEFKQFKLIKQLSLNSVIDSHPRNRNLQDNLCNLFWEFNYFIGLNKKNRRAGSCLRYWARLSKQTISPFLCTFPLACDYKR